MRKLLQLIPAILFICTVGLLHAPATAQDEMEALENLFREALELEEPFEMKEAWVNWVYSMGVKLRKTRKGHRNPTMQNRCPRRPLPHPMAEQPDAPANPYGKSPGHDNES